MTSAIDMAVTRAVSTFGNTLGAVCQVSRRNTSVVPGRSSKLLRGEHARAPARGAQHGQPGAVGFGERGFLAAREAGPHHVGQYRLQRIGGDQKPDARPLTLSGRHSSISSEPSPSA